MDNFSNCMHDQFRWLYIAETWSNQPLWYHYLHIAVPDVIRDNTYSLLVVEGGDNDPNQWDCKHIFSFSGNMSSFLTLFWNSREVFAELSKPGWIPLLVRVITYVWWTAQIHLWCDTSKLLGRKHGNRPLTHKLFQVLMDWNLCAHCATDR